MKDIMHAPVARRMFLLFIWPWTICGLAYYGIFLSVKLVNVDKYTLTGITVSIEFFVLLAVIFPINKVNHSSLIVLNHLSMSTDGPFLYSIEIGRYSIFKTV
jgi:hypothetical protein